MVGEYSPAIASLGHYYLLCMQLDGWVDLGGWGLRRGCGRELRRGRPVGPRRLQQQPRVGRGGSFAGPAAGAAAAAASGGARGRPGE